MGSRFYHLQPSFAALVADAASGGGEFMTGLPPVSIFQATGFYRNGRWFDAGALSFVARCNCSLPDDSGCEYVMAALTFEGAETVAYAHLKAAHPKMVEDQLWSEFVERVRIIDGST